MDVNQQGNTPGDGAPAAFLTRAIELAVENVRAGRGGPFGAVIVKDGRIVAEAANRVTADNDPTAHAEILAIRAASRALDAFHLDGCELYASCEPCTMCLGAIFWARIARVYYAAMAADAARAGFDDAFIDRQLELPPESRAIPMRRLATGRERDPFAAWEQQPGKIPY